MHNKADKILKTTVSLFIRDGVRKITMDDIAEYSKVSKVTIYNIFVDKDSLFLEISKYIFSDYIEKLQGVIASGETLLERLYNYLNIISDFINSGKYELCRELALYNHAIETEYELYLKTYKQSMKALVDEGLESGLIKTELDRDVIFHYIDMGVAYYQHNAEYRNKMLGDSAFQEQFMLFYISNIFTDSAQILSAK